MYVSACLLLSALVAGLQHCGALPPVPLVAAASQHRPNMLVPTVTAAPDAAGQPEPGEPTACPMGEAMTAFDRDTYAPTCVPMDNQVCIKSCEWTASCRSASQYGRQGGSWAYAAGYHPEAGVHCCLTRGHVFSKCEFTPLDELPVPAPGVVGDIVDADGTLLAEVCQMVPVNKYHCEDDPELKEPASGEGKAEGGEGGDSGPSAADTWTGVGVAIGLGAGLGAGLGSIGS